MKDNKNAPAAINAGAPAEIEALKALALAATPQNFDSAQIKSYGGEIECPACGGEGMIEAGNDYCNYDNAPLGATFYGIGKEHRNAEAYYRAASPAVVLDLIARIERAAAPAQTSGDWMLDRGLIYRLNDEGVNCDEINVTMSNGSRSEDARYAAAAQLLALIVGADRAAVSAATKPTADLAHLTSTSIRDYPDFTEDVLRLSEPGLSRKQAKIIRKAIYDTIDARVRNSIIAAQVACERADVQSLLATKPAAAPTDEQIKTAIVHVLNKYETEMEGYSYFGSNPGVKHDDYDDIAADTVQCLAELRTQAAGAEGAEK